MGACPHLLLCKEVIAIEDEQVVLGESMFREAEVILDASFKSDLERGGEY